MNMYKQHSETVSIIYNNLRGFLLRMCIPTVHYFTKCSLTKGFNDKI